MDSVDAAILVFRDPLTLFPFVGTNDQELPISGLTQKEALLLSESQVLKVGPSTIDADLLPQHIA